MARKLASIVEIESCEPIPDTDRLSVATMKGKGWRVVTGRDEFKPGNLACYFEIDSFIRADDPRYEFLRDRCLRKFVSKGGNVLREGIRIKTCKLRGVVSQGLLMPLSKFPEVTDNILWNAEKRCDEWIDGSSPVGQDVTDILHVEHYDEVKERLQPAMGNPIAAEAMGNFPSAYVPKTDEPRLQGLTEYFETMKGRLFEVTEKRDGSSISFGYCPMIDRENPFMVCSRNLRLKPVKADGTVPMMWQLVNKMGLEEKCRRCPNLMFQAEFCGMGVNGNRDRLNEYTIEVFRVYNVETQLFIEAETRRRLCAEMGVPHVPVIDPALDVFNRFHTMDEILAYADGKTARGNPREGLVFKEIGTMHPISYKVVSNMYLLSEKD